MSDKLGISGNVAVITGGGGAIGGEIARTLARRNVSVAIWDIDQRAAERKAADINASGGIAVGLHCDITRKSAIAAALDETLKRFPTVHYLVNSAGGSNKATTTSPDLPFEDIDVDAMVQVFSQNYLGTVAASQLVAREFIRNNAGSIVNISSIAGILPLTRAVSYSDAKAAVNSFTKWLAVHMAQHYSTRIRINAVAPGFILTRQNRFLLVDEKTGELTERGQQIFHSVPMGRFGTLQEIADAVQWLLSDKASFITGAVIPVDGGYTAFSGV